jgi:hypothetical protein
MVALPLLRPVCGQTPHTKIHKGAKMGAERDFVDNLVHTRFAYNYSYDGLGSLPHTAQSKCSYLKILKIQNLKTKLFFLSQFLSNIHVRQMLTLYYTQFYLVSHPTFS